MPARRGRRIRGRAARQRPRRPARRGRSGTRQGRCVRWPGRTGSPARPPQRERAGRAATSCRPDRLGGQRVVVERVAHGAHEGGELPRAQEPLGGVDLEHHATNDRGALACRRSPTPALPGAIAAHRAWLVDATYGIGRDCPPGTQVSNTHLRWHHTGMVSCERGLAQGAVMRLRPIVLASFAAGLWMTHGICGWMATSPRNDTSVYARRFEPLPRPRYGRTYQIWRRRRRSSMTCRG